MKQQPKTFIKKTMPSPAKRVSKPTQESPKINRSIAERFSLHLQPDTVFIVSFLSGMVIVGIILSGLVLTSDMKEQRTQKAMRMQQTKELAYWEGIVRTYPDYRDAYLKVGSLSFSLGNTAHAQQVVEKAIALDPNYMPARELAVTFLSER